MAYALASRLERAVKRAGVKYRTVSGWRNRGRAAMGSIQSVMCHHTAGPASGNSPSLNVVAYGRPGLSGPLSQLFLARDGTVIIVAAGRANHAGRVSSNRYSNSHSIGIEAEATGTSSWPDVQMDAYAKLCKALIDEFGLSTSRVIGHKEAAVPRGRKIDPNFNMDQFRRKVGGSTTPKPTPKPKPIPEGLFGMTVQKPKTRQKDLKLPQRKWKTIPADDKGNTSILFDLEPGDGAMVNAHIALKGLPPGANAQVRFFTVSYKAGTKTRRLWTHYMDEIVGTAGTTYANLSFLRRNTSKAAKGRSIRIRAEIRVFDAGVTLTRAQFNRAKG